MRKIKKGKFKFCLRVLSIILILNMIIGYFPKGLVIADTVISGDVDIADTYTSNDVDSSDTRKASDTNADYLGKVKFYDYYGSNKIGTIGNNASETSNGYHYYFEKFNKAVSDYSNENNIMYPLYFGDFNYAAGESNNPEKKPETGQTLMGSAYKFFWAANRASRSENSDTTVQNSKYTASVQGLVSDTLIDGKLTQDIKTINYDKASSKNFNISSVNCSSNTNYENLSSALGRNNVLKLNYPGSAGSKDYRIQLTTYDRDFSKYSKYLTFDVYNETASSGGSLFIALKDGSNRQIAGWSKFYGTEYYDNTIKSKEWQTVVIDLEELKLNDNNLEHGTYQPQYFNFGDVTSIFVGYWGTGGGLFIDKSSIKFLGDIVETSAGTVELPYFNSEFLSNYNVGQTTDEYEFPFKKRSKTVTSLDGQQKIDADYYIFSSGKSGYQINNSTLTDVVRINRITNHLDYWFDEEEYSDNVVLDMNGKEAGFGGTGKNEPGFFPFNTPTQGGKLDAPNSYTENGLNYGFGAKIEIQFKLTEDGTMTTTNGVKIPLEFNFKGDDDVWVYVDGQLALDMGGGHSQTEGNINFATGIATVKNVVDGKITSNSLMQPVTTKTKNLNLSNDSYISEGKYDTNKVHTLTLFYMERGMIESNLYMDFNFIPSQNEVIVEKEVDTSGVNEVLSYKTAEIANNIEFKFNVFENNNVKKETEYVHSEYPYDRKTDNENGKFVLKDKNTATFLNKFSEGAEIYFTEDEDTRFTTTWRWENTGNIFEQNLSGEGYSTSSVTIPKNQGIFENYIYHAIFTNKTKTGNLQISKEIELLQGDNLDNYKDDIFDFKVTFTSILGTQIEPINYNGSYSVFINGVYKEDRQAVQIGDHWVIQLKAGETAKIKDIPVDTEYKIEEILGDKYEIQSINGQNANGNSSITGKITVEDSEATVTYVNKKKLKDVKLIKVDSSDPSIKLQYAKFILNRLNEDGSIDENFEQREVTSDENGQASFIGLPYGKYMITEVQAPEGYELLKEPIKFEVNKDNNNSVITIEVKNNKSIKLPAAGGNGNITSKYIGFMLIGLAGILYSFVIIRNKKYKFN